MLQDLGARALHLLLTFALLLGLKLSPYPESVALDLRRVVTAIEHGRADAASDGLEAALAMEPGMQAIREHAARAALAAGRPSMALQHLDVLAQYGASPGDSACLEVEAYHALDRLQSAEAWLEQAGPGCAASVALARDWAATRLAAGDAQGAESALRLWASLQPGSAEAHGALGAVLAVRQPGFALSHLRLAMELDPAGDPMIQRLIRAIEDSRPADSPAYTLARVGLELAGMRRWDLSRLAFEQAVAKRDDFAEAWAYLGLAADRSGRNGLQALLKAIDLAPDLTMAHFLLAKHWQGADQPGKALASLETAARLDPHDPAIAAELGATYAALGDMRSAEAAYEKATQLAPEEPAFWQLLAAFSLENEIEIEGLCLRAAREALSLSPDDPGSLDLLGYCHFLLGNLPLAGRHLWEAARLDPGLPAAHYHRGLLLLAQGDRVGGRQALITASALDPQGRVGELAQRSLSNLED